jgi:hypothetical protein
MIGTWTDAVDALNFRRANRFDRINLFERINRIPAGISLFK